jgi:hypothetical protein
LLVILTLILGVAGIEPMPFHLQIGTPTSTATNLVYSHDCGLYDVYVSVMIVAGIEPMPFHTKNILLLGVAGIEPMPFHLQIGTHFHCN